MKNNSNNQPDEITKITDQIWRLFDIVRGSLPIEDFKIILLFVAAYNDGYLERGIITLPLEEIPDELELQLGSSTEYNAIYKEFQNSIREISLSDLNLLLNGVFNISYNPEYYKEVFESLLFKLGDAQGKMSGVFIQPIEISQFIMTLPVLSEKANVYNPFAGLASYGTFLTKHQNYYGQEKDVQTWALGMLRLMAHKNSAETFYENDDSIDSWNDHIKFDLIVSTPPFNLKVNSYFLEDPTIKTGEQFLIRNGLIALKEDGKLICVLSHGFLFRGGEDKILREELVNNSYLESIIALPSGLLKNTGISTCILVINKSRLNNGLVRIVNATDFSTYYGPRDKKLDIERLSQLINSGGENEYQRFVSKEEIIQSDYNLNVSRYFIKEYQGVILSSVVQPYKGQTIESGEIGKFIRIRDLKDDKLDHLLNAEQIDIKEIPKYARKIDQSCILLATRWNTLKPTYFKFEGNPIYISNDITALKVDESTVDIQYLINDLHSKNALDQIESYRVTGVIPMIRKEDFLSIKIELPSIEEQRGIVKGLKELSQKIKLLEKERNALVLGKIIAEFDEFASLKHSLGAPRQNILSNAKSLIRFFERNDSEAFIQVRNQFKNDYNTDLSEVLIQIRENIDHISVILEKGEGGLILNNYQKEIVPLKDINSILKNYSDNGYKFKIRYDSLVKDEMGKNALVCNTTLFKILLDNIFSNADKYGFQEKYSANEVVIELKVIDEFLEVIIKNNGAPFPKNFTKEKFITKFRTVDSENGSGIGGYDINRIASYFGDSDWQLILDDTNLYPVEFKFSFPLKTIEDE
ncbi:MAG: N-6 DNA methylase [Lutibacter sp.]